MNVIEELAKYKHAILLSLAGLMTCIPLGMMFNQPIHAQPTVKSELSQKTFKSQGLTDLLVHHFGMQDDKDIATNGHTGIMYDLHKKDLIYPKKNRIYELDGDGNLGTYATHGWDSIDWGHHYFTEVSDQDTNRYGGISEITYSMHNNHLILGQLIFPDHAIPNSIKKVDYKLVKIIQNSHKSKVLVFAPVSFALVGQHKETVPKKVQKTNLLKLTILKHPKWDISW